jgi:hypothetical protein
MADMFKPRKIPKHLILQDNFVYRRPSRSGLLKWVLWFIGFLLATGLALEVRHLNGI